jgi:hypothetical protein
MPVNNFSVGRDLNFTLVGPYGVVTVNGVTDYAAKQMSTDLKHKGLDGIVRHGEIPDGWEISIKLERQDPILDQLFARLEADYYAGVNIQGGTIVETITEKDGSISQYRYEGVVLKLDGAGDFKGDSFVSLGLTGNASRRIRVS